VPCLDSNSNQKEGGRADTSVDRLILVDCNGKFAVYVSTFVVLPFVMIFPDLGVVQLRESSSSCHFECCW
jgi:hypothetical protein